MDWVEPIGWTIIIIIIIIIINKLSNRIPPPQIRENL